MKGTTKFLTTVLIIVIIYSVYKLFTGQGGSGLYDFVAALHYGSIFLFLCSLTILLLNYKDLNNQIGTVIFLILSLPFTLSSAIGLFNFMDYNRNPNLVARYSIPVTRKQYLEDSLNIKTTIDSLTKMRNIKYGGPDIQYSIIDTIIYSQSGDKVFVSYINKFEKNDLGNNFDPDFLVADTRDSLNWRLTNASYSLGGSFHDIKSLKKEVRKFYFNQFTFLDKDSVKENYFWRVVL